MTLAHALPEWAAVVERRVQEGHAPGMVALVDRGGVAEIHAAGHMNLQICAPMRGDTLFRLASVSKLVTAVGAMTLVDEGCVHLDEPVDRWLPELAERRVLRSLTSNLDDTVPARGPVTLRHLLAMTWGIGMDFGYHSAVSDSMRRVGVLGTPPQIGADEFMRRLGSLPLICHPGERWLYHVGIDVAGVLMERISGRDLATFLKARIFDPLGMKDTGFQLDAERRQRLATEYADMGGGRYVAAPSSDESGPPPRMRKGGSGLISTAADLGVFGRMLLNGGVHREHRILACRSIAEMRRDHVSDAAKRRSPVFPGFWESYGWGLGMCVALTGDRVSSIPGRFGWWGGTGTGLFMDPATDTVMVSLTQRHIRDISDSTNADAFMRAALAN